MMKYFRWGVGFAVLTPFGVKGSNPLTASLYKPLQAYPLANIPVQKYIYILPHKGWSLKRGTAALNASCCS